MIEVGSHTTRSEVKLSGNTTKLEQPAEVRMFAEKSWLDSTAVDQLHKTALLPGMKLVAGMPDLHPGQGGPVGAAFATRDLIYPSLIGSDIGCGMAFFGTELAERKLKIDKVIKKLGSIEGAWEGDAEKYLADRNLALQAKHSLGTIGGGNHFAELTAVQDVYDAELLARLGVDAKKLSLLVHSGSRSYGQSVLDDTRSKWTEQGMRFDSEFGKEYLSKHDYAVKWATANRELIAERFLNRIGSDSSCILDVPHNLVCKTEIGGEDLWLHRKGAAPSNRGAVIIPGSRGTLSYLVIPEGDGESSAFSLAHGAGRKWARGSCKEKLEKKYDVKSLSKTALGGHVICEDKDLIYQEAPQAYKDISDIISDLQSKGLIHVIASFRPVLTYKVKAPSDDIW